MTEPETCSSEVDVFSEPDKSAQDSEASYRRKRLSYHHQSYLQTDNSIAKVNTLKKKQKREELIL